MFVTLREIIGHTRSPTWGKVWYESRSHDRRADMTRPKNESIESNGNMTHG